MGQKTTGEVLYTTATANYVVPLPAGAAVNDIIVVQFSINASTGSWTTVPSGWTQRLAPTFSGSACLSVYYYQVTGSDPSSFTFTWASGTAVAGNLHYGLYDSIDWATGPWDGFNNASSGSTTITVTGFTTTVNNSFLIGGCNVQSASTATISITTPASGWTIDQASTGEGAGRGAIFGHFGAVSPAGGTGNVVYTKSSALGGVGWIGALKASAAPTYHNAKAAVVPAYFYPTWWAGSDWDTLEANPGPDTIVIVNPASGPGVGVNTDYTTELAQAFDAGLKLIGYVDLSYSTRTIGTPSDDFSSGTVFGDINAWLSFYGDYISGFFFDQVSSGADGLVFTKEATDYARSKLSGARIITNQGTYPTEEGYLALADILCVWEGHYTTNNYATFTVPSYATDYVNRNLSTKFLHLVYGCANATEAHNAFNVAYNCKAGWMFATDNASAWNSLATFWTTDEVTWYDGLTTSGSVSARWVGATTRTSARIAVKTPSASSVRIKVGTNAGLTTGVRYSTPAIPSPTRSWSKHELTGLSPGTTYFYAVEMDGVLNATVKTFKTMPASNSFAFGFASCLNTSSTTTTAFDVILAAGIDAFFHTGDFHYADIITNDRAAYESAMVGQLTANAGLTTLLESTPTYYSSSDHDSGNNNWSPGPGTQTPAFLATYREMVPSAELGAADGTYQSVVIGRVRFVITDGRSFKSDNAATDNASKTMFGATQKAWIKEQLLKPEPVKCIVLDVPWIEATTAGSDKWGGFTTERTEMANFITTNGLNVFIIHGDAHSLCADDGTNSAGGVMVCGAAPLRQTTSIKGGPYSAGTWPTAGNTGSADSLVGRIVVTDNGSSIQVAYTGLDSTGTTRVSVSKTYSALSPVRQEGRLKRYTGSEWPYESAKAYVSGAFAPTKVHGYS